MPFNSEATERLNELIREISGDMVGGDSATNFPEFINIAMPTVPLYNIFENIIVESVIRLSENDSTLIRDYNIQIKEKPILYQCKEGNIKCSICFETIEKDNIVQSLPCSHCFHHECINNWVQMKEECPICRHKIEIINIGNT